MAQNRRSLLAPIVVRLSALIVALVLSCCGRQNAGDPLVLNDFEDQEDLSRLVWSCHTTFDLSAKARSHGQSGLWMTLYPAEYPGLRLALDRASWDWRGYRYLALSVFNPGQEEEILHYRIDDQRDPEYADRVNGSFRLAPGENRLRLDLELLRTSGSKRTLNLKRVWMLLFFQASPPKPVALGVDFIRLEGEMPQE